MELWLPMWLVSSLMALWDARAANRVATPSRDDVGFLAAKYGYTARAVLYLLDDTHSTETAAVATADKNCIARICVKLDSRMWEFASFDSKLQAKVVVRPVDTLFAQLTALDETMNLGSADQEMQLRTHLDQIC